MKKLSLACLGLSLAIGAASALAMPSAENKGTKFNIKNCPTYGNTFHIGDKKVANGYKWVLTSSGKHPVETGDAYTIDAKRGDTTVAFTSVVISGTTVNCVGSFHHNHYTHPVTAVGTPHH